MYVRACVCVCVCDGEIAHERREFSVVLRWEHSMKAAKDCRDRTTPAVKLRTFRRHPPLPLTRTPPFGLLSLRCVCGCNTLEYKRKATQG